MTDGADGFAAALGLVTHGTRRDNPAAELDAIERLLALGASEQVIARETGLRLQTIRQRLRLGRLDHNLRQALRLGRLAVGVAEQAAKLPSATQQRLANRLAETGKVTSADVAAERQVRTQQATAALPFAFLTAVPAVAAGSAGALSVPAVQRLTTWLEAALHAARDDGIQDVVALGDGTLLVQLGDGSACTIQVSAGAAAYAEVA